MNCWLVPPIGTVSALITVTPMIGLDVFSCESRVRREIKHEKKLARTYDSGNTVP